MKFLSIALLFFISLSANAYTFTTAQATLLRTAALAEPTIQSCITAGDDGCVANWFNSPSIFVVWKTYVSCKDLYEKGGYDYTLFDGLTQGKRDEWDFEVCSDGHFNPSLLNARNGIIDVYSGTSAKLANQAIIFNYSQRFATNAEKVLATGTGTSASPGLLTFEGIVQVGQVGNIMRP